VTTITLIDADVFWLGPSVIVRWRFYEATITLQRADVRLAWLSEIVISLPFGSAAAERLSVAVRQFISMIVA